MKKLLLMAGFTAALLSACGSPAPPTQTEPPPSSSTSPADAPADATVSQEFTFDRKTSGVVMQSLGLQPLDAVDLGNRLRVVLSVTQAKSGANAGKKRASAVFIWGNQQVKLTGNYILGLSRAGEEGTLTSTNGKMNLGVTYPDYQAKVSKNTSYSADPNALCATLTFNLKADVNAWDSNLPVRVCERRSSRQVEDDALMQAADGTFYRVDSIGISKVKFIRLSSEAQKKALTTDDIRRYLNLPNYIPIRLPEQNDFWVYFADEPALRNDTKQVKKAVAVLKTMYRFYGYNARAFAIRETPERERIVFVGWNNLGIAGVEMWRFMPPDGLGNPGYERAQTYPALWRDGGSVVGYVQVGLHDPQATVTGRYAVRSATTCTAGVNVTLDKALTFDQRFPVENNGLTSTQFTFEPMPNTGQDVVIDYAVTVNLNGLSKTYTGVACDILTPPPPAPPPSVNDVQLYPWFERNPNITTIDGRHEVADISIDRFDGSIPFWNYAGSMTASGTYRIENAPECGAATRTTLSSGNLTYQVEDYVEMVGFGLSVPGEQLANITPTSRLVYSVTVTGQDGPRVIEGARCVNWTD